MRSRTEPDNAQTQRRKYSDIQHCINHASPPLKSRLPLEVLFIAGQKYSRRSFTTSSAQQAASSMEIDCNKSYPQQYFPVSPTCFQIAFTPFWPLPPPSTYPRCFTRNFSN
jgi:hypothetical protein